MSEILEHATRLFAERGYDGTTLQDIADAIGITRPGLYNYISSKEQLLAELVRDVSESTAHIDLPVESQRSVLVAPPPSAPCITTLNACSRGNA